MLNQKLSVIMEKDSKELDDFIKKYVKDLEQDVPSIDFTKNIMNQIVVEKKPVFQNNSKLSNSILFVFLGFVLAIASSLYGKKSVLEEYQIDFTLPELNINLPELGEMTMYALVCLTIFCFVQVYYFNKYQKL